MPDSALAAPRRPTPSGRAGAPVPAALPPAPADRRFYAFVVDRVLAWGLYAAAGLAAALLLDDAWTVVGVVVGVVLLVGLVSALLLGLRGTSPGKALFGLRLVGPAHGGPIGVPAALLRTLLLGAVTLPTLGLGTAALAWTALADRGGARRGAHDLITHGVVVDERPPAVEEAEPEAVAQQIVNLTAMRLMPAPSRPTATPVPRTSSVTPVPPVPVAGGPLTPPPPAPPSTPPPPAAPPAPAAPSGAPAEPGERPRLGWPLLPAPPAGGAHAASSATAGSGGHRTRGGRRRAETTAEREARQRPNAATRWRVTFDTGESLVVEGLTLVGRRPEPRAGEPVRHLLPLRSQDMSLSKTHAQLQVAPDGVLVVLDRGSTNGTFLVRQGAARPLPAGRATTLADGDRVRFGDREMSVVRES